MTAFKCFKSWILNWHKHKKEVTVINRDTRPTPFVATGIVRWFQQADLSNIRHMIKSTGWSNVHLMGSSRLLFSAV